MVILRENPARLLREMLREDWAGPRLPPPTSGTPAEITPPVIPALLSMRLIRQFYLPVDERTLDRWLSSGKFPQADIKQGAKVRLWKRETVEGWIENSCATSCN